MDFEKYFSSSGIKGNIQQAIAAETADALKDFCRQEAEFAQAVQQSGKSFQNCLDYVAKGAGSSLSDFKASFIFCSSERNLLRTNLSTQWKSARTEKSCRSEVCEIVTLQRKSVHSWKLIKSICKIVFSGRKPPEL